MERNIFDRRLEKLRSRHKKLISKKNKKVQPDNGIFCRYKRPVLTAGHTPLFWRYDLNPETNPFLMERLGINAVFNPGAIYHGGKYILLTRTEGYDRKSFFAVAESPNGIDGFRFRDYPVEIPPADQPDVNVYDIRLIQHEDGWIYGIFCTERKDPHAPPGDTSAAIAQCGIIRTRDLKTWERLPDLKTPSPQQRNCVLHPTFVDGKYALYTRPQDDFINPGKGGGIGWALVDDMENPVVDKEIIINHKTYHTIKELKNGQGPAPLKTDKGWLHMAHGVRNTAAGLRYVLYMFMTDLKKPWMVTHEPGGYFLAPEGAERVGDVSNVAFCNGWIVNDKNEVFIYYASSDTRTHVATSTIERLVDYVMHTPPDEGTSGSSLKTRMELIERNLSFLGSSMSSKGNSVPVNRR